MENPIKNTPSVGFIHNKFYDVLEALEISPWTYNAEVWHNYKCKLGRFVVMNLKKWISCTLTKYPRE